MVENFAEMEKKYVMRTWSVQGKVNVLPIVDAEGAYFTDINGKKYIDFSSQLIASNYGHKNPKINKAITEQLEKYAYIAPALGSPPRALLAKKLSEIAPGKFRKTFFSCAGAEAIEGAVKGAKYYTGKFKVISRFTSYHGSLGITISLTGDPRRYTNNEPGYPGVLHAVDPYCFRCPFRTTYPECNLLCAEAIRDQIILEGKNTVAALVLEPIVGSNGIIVPPPGYYERIREICDETEVVWIDDEVMAGFGRTGKMFAVEHWKASPDIITMAKGLTGTYIPLGATLFNDKISDYFDDHLFCHGHTYSGHPVACATGIASIDLYREEKLVENAANLEKVFRKRLEEIKEDHKSVGDVRGKGCFWGVELIKDQKTLEPASIRDEKFAPYTTIPANVQQACFKNGVFFLQMITTLLLAPPLIVTKQEVLDSLDVLDAALEISDNECK
ncbi:MAG: aminotransferase class III-fold pyridoxal phosphate-dependent enzyme [Candidatus Methanofastidiosia archaeon]